MSNEKWKCPKCGTENDLENIFCGDCGTKRPEIKPGVAERVVPKPANQETTPFENIIPKEEPKKNNKGIIFAIIGLAVTGIIVAVVLVFTAKIKEMEQREKALQEELHKQEQQHLRAEIQRLKEEENKRRHQCESEDRLFPCKDNSTGLIWSDRSSSQMNWSRAKQYCANLSEGGHSDWRLPNIDGLRSLIQNHSGTQTGGTCKISEKAGKLSWDDRTSDCDGRNGSNFSKLGDAGWFWSSSTRSDKSEYAWFVHFKEGAVYYGDKGYNFYVRCVR